MNFEVAPFFEEYEKLVAAADLAFEKIRSEYPDIVRCGLQCSDCCYALFDLTLIEALYINHHFNQRLDSEKREAILVKANRTDRTLYKIKRKANRDAMAGKREEEILLGLAEARVRCPLLNRNDRCDLYAHRPITCRLYGVPTAIRGKGHTCGLSGFVSGKAYPTVNIDNIHRRLLDISMNLIRALQSRHLKMADMLVPVSMALLTEFDDAYLGVAEPKEGRKEKGETDA